MGFVLAIAMSALIAGCEPKQKVDSENSLTAEELARLQDFHVWKISLPPCRGFKLVLVKSDGSKVVRFSTLPDEAASASGWANLTNNYPSPMWTSVLLGLRMSASNWVGNVEAGTTNGSITYHLDFTNEFAESPRSWSFARPSLFGDHVELATFWDKQNQDKTNMQYFNTLEIEVVK